MYKLRELNKKDIATINKWRNDKKLIDYLGTSFRYIDLDIDNIWYESYLNNRDSNVRCSITEEGKEDYILGLVSLTNIDPINQIATFHIMVGDSERRGKGIGYFATTEILKHAFNNMNLYRIELTVLETNIRAINLYERVGFKREGIKRNSLYKNGQFVNVIIMGILKEEFMK